MKTVQLKSLVAINSHTAGKEKYPVLSITAGVGFVNQAEKFGKEIAGAQYVHYTVLKRGDFSYNKGNSKTYPQGCIYRQDEYEYAAVPNVFNSFRFTSKDVDVDYYKYLFESGYLNRQLYRLINSGVRNDGLLNIYDEDFYSCKVPCPPLEEQKRIAEILECCDKVIRLKRELLAEKKKQKKSLMQKLLNPDSGFRLPGFEGEWKTVKLSDICDINLEVLSENTPPQYTFKYIDLSAVGSRKLVAEPKKICFAEAPCRARRIFYQGDILFSLVRPYLQGFLLVDFAANNYIASTGFAILHSRENICSEFVFQQLFSISVTLQIQSFLTGTNYPALNGSDIDNIRFSIPTIIEEQQAIAKILTAADHEIDFIEQDLSQWEQKKKSLMQLLLTGKVRVIL